MSEGVKEPAPAGGLQARRVARTEDALIEAARRLFLEQGYVTTTLAQVAGQAGVAARTVYVRFGTKAALFRRVMDRALVGDAEPIDVAHRPRTLDAMTAETLDARIEAFADVAVGIAERAGALFEIAAQADGVEPEIAEAARAGRRDAADLCAHFWRRAGADRLLPDGLDLATLATITDLVICADSVVHFRRTHGWSASGYRTIVVAALSALAGSGDRPPAPRKDAGGGSPDVSRG